MNDLDRELLNITPRAATVTLLLFDRVVTRYETEFGHYLSDAERATVASLLREIAARERTPDGEAD